MTVHISNKLSCPKKKCDRQFKNIWDLNHHMNSHKKGGWYHCNYCDYKNKDKRNTDSHMHIHSTDEEDKWYECDKCGKHMRFSTQFKWHKEQGCNALCEPLHVGTINVRLLVCLSDCCLKQCVIILLYICLLSFRLCCCTRRPQVHFL